MLISHVIVFGLSLLYPSTVWCAGASAFRKATTISLTLHFHCFALAIYRLVKVSAVPNVNLIVSLCPRFLGADGVPGLKVERSRPMLPTRS